MYTASDNSVEGCIIRAPRGGIHKKPIVQSLSLLFHATGIFEAFGKIFSHKGTQCIYSAMARLHQTVHLWRYTTSPYHDCMLPMLLFKIFQVPGYCNPTSSEYQPFMMLVLIEYDTWHSSRALTYMICNMRLMKNQVIAGHRLWVV